MKVLKHLTCIQSTFLLFGCYQNSEKTTVQESRIIEVSHNYDEIKDFELVWDSMFDVNSVHYYVYFYSTTCSHCEELKNYIIEKALLEENIYFVKGSSKDQIGNDPKKSKYAENPGDIWILGYPSLIEITSHKCMKNLAGISQIKAELN